MCAKGILPPPGTAGKKTVRQCGAANYIKWSRDTWQKNRTKNTTGAYKTHKDHIQKNNRTAAKCAGKISVVSRETRKNPCKQWFFCKQRCFAAVHGVQELPLFGKRQGAHGRISNEGTDNKAKEGGVTSHTKIWHRPPPHNVSCMVSGAEQRSTKSERRAKRLANAPNPPKIGQKLTINNKFHVKQNFWRVRFTWNPKHR